MSYVRYAMRSLPNKFRRCNSTSVGTEKRDESFSRKDVVFVLSIIGSAAGLAYNLDAKIGNLDVKFDRKIGSNSDKSDAKFESLRSELGSNSDKSDAKLESLLRKIESNSDKSDAKFESLRSEILSAFSSMQGERIRALEVVAAQQKK